jgi:hypothetical protein
MPESRELHRLAEKRSAQKINDQLNKVKDALFILGVVFKNTKAGIIEGAADALNQIVIERTGPATFVGAPTSMFSTSVPMSSDVTKQYPQIHQRLDSLSAATAIPLQQKKQGQEEHDNFMKRFSPGPPAKKIKHQSEDPSGNLSTKLKTEMCEISEVADEPAAQVGGGMPTVGAHTGPAPFFSTLRKPQSLIFAPLTSFANRKIRTSAATAFTAATAAVAAATASPAPAAAFATPEELTSTGPHMLLGPSNMSTADILMWMAQNQKRVQNQEITSQHICATQGGQFQAGQFTSKAWIAPALR